MSVNSLDLANRLQDINFPQKDEGLLPAIVQDAETKEVLMLAYANRESLQKTIETRTTWFWSRSRKALWNKGATSGNIQEIVDIRYDCDQDTLLFLVNPKGPACHTGENTCFYRSFFDGWPKQADDQGNVETPIASNMMGKKQKPPVLDFLYQLEQYIQERKETRPEGSYTTYLFDEGVDKILKKIAEESGEVIIAAKNNSTEELVYESADLMYHLIVLLQNQGITIEQIVDELANRHKKDV
ncbi:bifunctional phosphoribosyl-AMP cyclohydrolase/phosphoribosyl-ATP pyrophosphatase [Desulfuribacillus alkaliarsenatis]|uniref:Histidine biosynthesis bifunctional protein HisIE n=2 Tax=Desulfuribacillus alkaliarsenatis TaxID=766136 RepID=A0A1E5G475_9FIRM|nr:bifunctional phosphoribosyl-AMP cyclohydrolase/phosphoribosyl-ATP pyrophosphatase [Desulfuribacillus alkaliarsenatis]